MNINRPLEFINNNWHLIRHGKLPVTWSKEDNGINLKIPGPWPNKDNGINLNARIYSIFKLLIGGPSALLVGKTLELYQNTIKKNNDESLPKQLFDLINDELIGKDELIEILKFEIQIEPNLIFENIHKFGINSRRLLEFTRFELAKIMAKSDINFSERMKSFHFNKPQYLYELALITAKNFPSQLNEYFENYKINNQEQQYELAKITIKDRSLYSQGQNLQKFNLLSEAQLKKLLLKSVNENPRGVARNYNYPIRDQEFIKQLTNNLLLKVPNDLMEHFQSFAISDPDRRYHLAKILANNLNFCPRKIQNFSLDNSEQRLEIAKIVVPKYYNYSFRLSEDLNLTPNQEVELFIHLCLKSENPFSTQNELMESRLIRRDSFGGLQLLFEGLLPSETEDLALIEPFIKLEKETTSQEVRLSVRKWLGYHLLMHQSHSRRNELYGEMTHSGNDNVLIMQSIMQFHHLEMRYLLTNLFFKLLKLGSNHLEIYQALEKFKMEEVHCITRKKTGATVKKIVTTMPFRNHNRQLYRLFLAYFINDSLELKDWEHVFKVLQANTYNDACVQMDVINVFFSLLNNDKLLASENKQLILATFKIGENINSREDRAKLINRNLQYLETFLYLDKAYLKKIVLTISNGSFPSDEILEKTLRNIFCKLMGEIEVKEFTEKFEKKFTKLRQPLAFITYASCLQQLKPSQKSAILPHLKQFFSDVLEDDYSKNRYLRMPGDHLSTVFGWKPGFEEIWKKGNKESLINFHGVEKEALTKEFSIKSYLQQKICEDRHLDPDKFPRISQCLISADYQAIDASMKDWPCPSPIAEIDKLQKTLITLIDDRNPHDKLKLIDLAISYHFALYKNDNNQFIQDLKDLKDIMVGNKRPLKQQDWNGWVIEETDHWEDLLLCGTEVSGSCQRINGDCGLNKCLLNYVIDGKNRIVVIKDSSGKIRCREIIRLLWDKISNQPVLFRERTYVSPGITDNLILLMKKMCIQKAEALGVPLVKLSKNSSASMYPNSLYSLNAKAPFEYVDALRCITNGEFEISSNLTEVIYQSK